MPGLAEPDGSELHVVIVGGGASGTLTAVQLLRNAAERQLPMQVTLVDRHGRHGLGQAYSTTYRPHLLNAMAGQLSALPDEPDHLVTWASSANGGAGPFTAAGDPERSRGVTATAFLPRQEYGRYLQTVLADAERQALPVARLTRLSDEVVAIGRCGDRSSRTARLLLPGGGSGSGLRHLDADFVVLATGNAPASLPFEVPASDRVITDPWLPGALDGALAEARTDSRTGSRAADSARARARKPVVIIGTGLTMIDLALALTEHDSGRPVYAISRHGLLPRTHPGVPSGNRQLWLPVISRTTGPVRLTDLMWQVRSTIASSPGNWQAVVDGLRPYVPGLWRRMPEEDKRLFLRHVARYWEVHRHLVPPPTASRLATLRATGQLKVLRGQVMSATPSASGGFRILVDAGSDTVELEAGWLINGTGFTGNIRASATPLVRDLFATGQARPDGLGLGIDASASGAILDLAGQESDVLSTLGPPLRGLWYETTAIPEIREQAAALARRITSASRLSQRPGSAA